MSSDDLYRSCHLGLTQGLTEFLPVSSSAHLRIAGYLLPGAQDPGAAFTAIVQIGTELAVVLYSGATSAGSGVPGFVRPPGVSMIRVTPALAGW
jgi:undecaprenyl pyrophosphate phosphatase UppP